MRNMVQDFLKDSVVDLLQITMVFAVVAIPVALLLSHVHMQYSIAQTGYDIASVTREHRALAEEYKKLQIEAAVQGRTERITTLAKERYGLLPTRPDQITIIEGFQSAQDDAPLVSDSDDTNLPEKHAALLP